MERNDSGIEKREQIHYDIWQYLPTEVWYMIFALLKATRYLVLIGTTSKSFQHLISEYFRHNTNWMGKNMCVAIIGAPDVGKTTTLAQLLLQTQEKTARQFAKYLDAHPKLRLPDQYNTFLNHHIGPAITYTQTVNSFHVNNALHQFTFLDTPGSDRRLMTAYRVCSQVNTVILMFSKRIDPKFDWLVNGITAVLASLTYSHFIITINYSYDEFTSQAFDEDKRTIGRKLSKVVPEKLLPYVKLIPINALEGFNIYSPRTGVNNTNSWYTGPTLYRALHSIWEKLEYNDERIKLPFVMPIIRTHCIHGPNTVFAGVVNSGCIKPGMKLKICAAGIGSKVLTAASIQHNRKEIGEGTPWNFIGVKVISKPPIPFREFRDQVRFSALLVDADNPPKRVQSFVAALVMPSVQTGQMREGCTYTAIYRTAHIFVTIQQFIQVFDKQHNHVDRKIISQGDSALALCVPTQDMWMHPPKQGKIVQNLNKKNPIEAILFTAQRRIQAVGRIDTVTFIDEQ